MTEQVAQSLAEHAANLVIVKRMISIVDAPRVAHPITIECAGNSIKCPDEHRHHVNSLLKSIESYLEDAITGARRP